jgi:hypothetical protein
MTTETPPPYWEYFLALESDLAKCSRYVEFLPDNYQIYSIEFARIIMAASSEFDTIAKEICNSLGNKNPKNVIDYRNTILNKHPCFCDYKIAIPKYNIDGFAPFENWKIPKNSNGNYTNPTWWTEHNDIKHNRVESSNFKKANLKNAIHSIGGLLTSLIYLYGLKCPEKLKMEISLKPNLLLPQSSKPILFYEGYFMLIDNPTVSVQPNYHGHQW